MTKTYPCIGAESGVCGGPPLHTDDCPSPTDARSLRLVRLVGKDGISSVVGPFFVLPPDEPLWMILKRAADHEIEQPTHGINCVCMDEIIRQIRASIARAHHSIPYEDKRMELHWKRKGRTVYVLDVAMRYL